MPEQTKPHQLTSTVKLLQKVVLLHDGKFLILRRSPDSGSRPELWDLPGGNAEWPTATGDLRNPHRADATREVLEETGITISTDELTDSCYVGSYFDVSESTYTIILGWLVQLPAEFNPQSVQISAEHTEFAWISALEFAAYDFGFAGEKDGFIRAMIVTADTKTRE